MYAIAMQKYGGSFVSFNELKKRADFIIVIGAKEENFSSFARYCFSKSTYKRASFHMITPSNAAIDAAKCCQMRLNAA